LLAFLFLFLSLQAVISERFMRFFLGETAIFKKPVKGKFTFLTLFFLIGIIYI